MSVVILWFVMTFSNPPTVSWTNQTKLFVGFSGALSLCTLCFHSDPKRETIFFGPFLPNLPNNTDTMPLFPRPCHSYASVLAFHLTTAILEPLWLIRAWRVCDQIILNPCFGVWPEEVIQGELTIPLNVPQANTFWDLSKVLPPWFWEADKK